MIDGPRLPDAAFDSPVVPKWRTYFEPRTKAGPGGCILWTRYVSPNGYGVLGVRGTSWQAHRYSWTLARGPIPDADTFHGTCVCHSCDVRLCVNPEHLFLGTQGENIRDMESKRRAVHPVGSRHVNAKLDEVKVAEMRRLYAAGLVDTVSLGLAYGVSQRAAWLAVNRKSWRHVP